MCGIFALLNPGGCSPRDRAWADAARQRLRLRGPDHQATYCSKDDLAILAHTRLSIVDPTPGANQPMVDAATGLVITYNGEIYNFPELRRMLAARGVQFATHCDTEVVLKLYAAEGPRGLRRLRGMYAFVLWDPHARQLVAARDPFGIKPLYAWQDKTRTVFSSQVRAIACGLDDIQTHDEALLEYGLFGHVFRPETPIRGIHEIPPGSIITIDVNGSRTELARADFRVLFELKRSEQFVDFEMGAALEESVAAHTLSDVPIGVLLSAGVDSTVVASRLAETADPRLIKSFTIGFKGDDVGFPDESPRAKQIAFELGFPSLSEAVNASSIAAILPAYFEAMDLPTVDAVNTYFASRLAHREGVKVALIGTGGDELFGGYPTFSRTPVLISPAGRTALALAPWLARSGAGRTFFNTDKLTWMREAGATVAGAYLVQRGQMSPEEVASAYECDVQQAQDVFRRVHDQLMDELGQIHDVWSAVSYLETRFYLLPRLLRDSDWAGMAHSVELRTPLVDWRLWRRLRPMIAHAQRGQPLPKRKLVRTALAPSAAKHLSSTKLGFSNPYRELARLADTEFSTTRLSPQQRWAKYVADRWSKAVSADRDLMARVA